MKIYHIGIYLYQNNELSQIKKIYNITDIFILKRYSFYKFINICIKNNIINNVNSITEFYNNKKINFNTYKYANIYYCIVSEIIYKSEKYEYLHYINQKKIIQILFECIHNDFSNNKINLHKYIIK